MREIYGRMGTQEAFGKAAMGLLRTIAAERLAVIAALTLPVTAIIWARKQGWW